MAQNSFGTLLNLATFGESHGPAIGGIIDGFPAGFAPDTELIRKQLRRRATGHKPGASDRKEPDQVEFLSGLFEGRTTGAPIAFIIRNKDARPEDYDSLKDIFRPSHADFTYDSKYSVRDHRGGGRSSARETTNWVVAGSLAMQWLAEKGIECIAFVSAIGGISIPDDRKSFHQSEISESPLACPHRESSDKMESWLEKLRNEGDSAGGIITCHINGVPPGLGEPVFDKYHALLGKSMLGINAAKGVEFGEGFRAVKMKGSEYNDQIMGRKADGSLETSSNNAGGLLGGISNGNPILFRVAFKPVASISKAQQTIDRDGNKQQIEVTGRHDACVVPRAVPVVESLAALVTMDLFLRHQAYNTGTQQKTSPND